MTETAATPPHSLLLRYQPPFDWESVLGVFRAHQLPHLESVDEEGYERVVKTNQGMGWLRVTHLAANNALRLQVWKSTRQDIESISTSVRRMFDLDADPDVIRAAMSQDPYLGEIWRQFPGLRVARSWNGFESMLTTILGQVVSVRFGRTLTRELMQAAGSKAVHPKTAERIHLFPTAKQILKSDLSGVRTSDSRRKALLSLAKLVQDGVLKWEHPIAHDELREILLSVPGIGDWTAEYVAMRGFHDDDAFPATDYGLKQELKRHPEVKVNRVRPWRAYAATALWKNYVSAKGTVYESVV
jgi:DNA-3-methyladenine glycosylase II